MKKTLCVLLALAMALCGAAFAENEPVYEFPEAGITMKLPEPFQQAEGTIVEYGGGELISNAGVYFASLYYLGMTEAEIDALDAKGDDLTDADMDAIARALQPLATVIAIDGGRDFDDINELLDGMLDDAGVREIGRFEDITYYSYPEEADGGLDFALADEYLSLRGMIDDALAKSEFYAPGNSAGDASGAAVSFTTTDLDGNPVDSADLFAAHEFTLVNIWATWCGPCVNELAELDALDRRLSELDCAVVGIVYDAEAQGAAEKAQSILSQKGASYLNLLPPDGLDDLFPLDAFPTTYFVNRDGEIVGSPVVGANVAGYETTVKRLLGGKS